MLVITIRFDEHGEGDKAFGSHVVTEFTRQFLDTMFRGPSPLELNIHSVPDHHKVTIEPPKK